MGRKLNMKPFDTIDGILSTLNVPFYSFMPEFAREPPDIFITYDVYDNPAFFGDGDELITRATVTFSVFGKNVSDMDRVYKNLCQKLKTSGFIRVGAKYSSDNDFPKFSRISVDYTFDFENDE